MPTEYTEGGKRLVKTECCRGFDGEPCGNCFTCNLGDPEVRYINGHRFVEQHAASGEFVCTTCGAWETDLDDRATYCKKPTDEPKEL